MKSKFPPFLREGTSSISSIIIVIYILSLTITSTKLNLLKDNKADVI